MIVILIFIVVGGALAYTRYRRPHGPKLLNENTAAREVRPFTTKPDPRFAPLPLEREKHGK
jgi:hypothetical protein